MQWQTFSWCKSWNKIVPFLKQIYWCLNIMVRKIMVMSTHALFFQTPSHFNRNKHLKPNIVKTIVATERELYLFLSCEHRNWAWINTADVFWLNVKGDSRSSWHALRIKTFVFPTWIEFTSFSGIDFIAWYSFYICLATPPRNISCTREVNIVWVHILSFMLHGSSDNCDNITRGLYLLKNDSWFIRVGYPKCATRIASRTPLQRSSSATCTWLNIFGIALSLGLIHRT